MFVESNDTNISDSSEKQYSVFSILCGSFNQDKRVRLGLHMRSVTTRRNFGLKNRSEAESLGLSNRKKELIINMRR